MVVAPHLVAGAALGGELASPSRQTALLPTHALLALELLLQRVDGGGRPAGPWNLALRRRRPCVGWPE